MTTTRVMSFGAIILLMSCTLQPQRAIAAGGQPGGSDDQIRIDIPVKLDKADIVFSMNHLVLRGDMPLGLRYMDLTAKNFKEAGTKGRIIGVFFNEAGHLTLNDKAYNSSRNVTSGNPYKGLIAELIQQGVQIEECAETMKAHNWSNDDLLPGVKVNAGAVMRMTQLTQQGFVQIHP